MTKGMFIAYWPCGICCGGAYIDNSASENGASKMLMEALREGRKVGYVGPQDVHPILIWHCPHSYNAGAPK